MVGKLCAMYIEPYCFSLDEVGCIWPNIINLRNVFFNPPLILSKFSDRFHCNIHFTLQMVYLPTYLSVCFLFFCPSNCLSVCLSIYLSFSHPSIAFICYCLVTLYLERYRGKSTNYSVLNICCYLFVHLFVLCVCVFLCLFVCLFVFVFVLSLK